MRIGRVKDNIVSTNKLDSLVGLKLLLVEIPSNEKSDFVVAVDKVGAGIGDEVIVVEGSNSKYAFDSKDFLPVDVCIVGIVDK